MDTGEGTFEKVAPELSDMLDSLRGRLNEKQKQLMGELWPKLFMVGEEITIRKSRFRVECIGNDLLVLRLLPA